MHSHSHTHTHEGPAQTEGRMIRLASFYDTLTFILTLGHIGMLRSMTVDLSQIMPGDRVLDVGCGRAPYKLFWELRYQEYEAIEGCVSGPNGNYNCGGGTGHRDITGYEWKNNSSGGEIPPSAVAKLPVALIADVNNDGTPDAYWDNNLTLRRMDDAGSVNNPQYQRSWNWGGVINWAVREGPGQ